MTITEAGKKNMNAKYMVCVVGKGVKAIYASCDTLDDVRDLIAAKGEWTFIAQGVDGLRLGGYDIEIRDRDAMYRGPHDQPKKYGIAAESTDLCRRSNGHNPKSID